MIGTVDTAFVRLIEHGAAVDDSVVAAGAFGRHEDVVEAAVFGYKGDERSVRVV